MSKKIKNLLIISGILILVSGFITLIIVLAINHFNLKELTGVKEKELVYEYDESFSNLDISVIESNVKIGVSEDEKTHVKVNENNLIKHELVLKDDTLYVKRVDYRRWYERFGLYDLALKSLKIEILLPVRTYENINLNTVVGKISFASSDAIFKNFKAASVSSDISLDSGIYENISLKTTSGDFALSNLVISGALNLKTVSGDVSLDKLSANDFNLSTTSGNLHGNEIKLKNEMVAKTVSGDLIFKDIDSLNYEFKTTSGNIVLTILSPKTITTETISGSIKLPTVTVGEGNLDCKTISGNIKITLI